MDTGALTNASAKISSLKPLTFTQQLLRAPYQNSHSQAVRYSSLPRDRTANTRRIRVDLMTKTKNIYCISQCITCGFPRVPRSSVIPLEVLTSLMKRDVFKERQDCSSLPNTWPTIWEGRGNKPAPEQLTTARQTKGVFKLDWREADGELLLHKNVKFAVFQAQGLLPQPHDGS